MDKPDDVIYRPESIVTPLRFDSIFANSYPVEMELGSGDGSFIAAWAAQNPQRNFLAIERLLGRLRKIGRKARRASLTNLRAIRIEASYLVQYLIPPHSLEAIHVYFPDPWPKRRHWRRRLINEDFTALAARALKTGGTIYLRTDNEDYFDQMTRVFADASMFELAETPAELRAVITDFERGFLAQGVSTRHAAYSLR